MKTVSDISSPKNSLKLTAQRDAILKGIEKGEKEIKEGRTCTHEEAKDPFVHQLKIIGDISDILKAL